MREGQKTRQSLNGMNGPKNTSNQGLVAGILLKLHQFPVHLVEVFITLSQKLFDDIIGFAHDRSQNRMRLNGLRLQSGNRFLPL
jgi:hypothetical protein